MQIHERVIYLLTAALRLTIIYVVCILCVRLMGKRQIGELEITELISAVFISELAADPIMDENIPLLHGIIPILLLTCFEIVLSFLSVKSDLFKRVSEKNPAYLINKGSPDVSELRKVRMTVNELATELRLKDAPDMSEVEYAILEPNGKMSVIMKAGCRPLCPNDLNFAKDENGMQHMVISDGQINDSALKMAGKDRKWLKDQLLSRRLTEKDVFILSVDDGGKIYLVQNDGR